MKQISGDFIKNNITYHELIHELKTAFRDSVIQCPPKSAYNYKSTNAKKDNVFLSMPAWDNQANIGIKLITATPNNPQAGIPYINGLYILFDAENGLPLAFMDAKLITNIRTAATSVLASNYLAKENASSVLIIGNGNITPYYIEAYASKPSVDTIYVWGRDFEKSKKVTNAIRSIDNVKVIPIESFESVSKTVDIITCITTSHSPILQTKHVAKGQHFDLVGSYTEDMQEVSTDVVSTSSIYTDNLDITLEHAGEIVNAVKEGKIKLSDIKGDLKFLCADDTHKRISDEENTTFKCTGMAIEDLVMAQLIYKRYNDKTEQ